MKSISYLLLGLMLAVSGCKDKFPSNGNIMPPAMNFALLDKQGVNLLTGIDTPLRVWFVKDGQPVYLGSECSDGCTMIRRAYSDSGSPIKYNYYYGSLGMSMVSSDNCAYCKTFYLQLGSKVDTLFVDVQENAPNDPLDKYDIVAVRFNGQPVAVDQDQLPIFPLRRQH